MRKEPIRLPALDVIRLPCPWSTRFAAPVPLPAKGLSPSRTFSGVDSRTSTKSAALPGVMVALKSFMNWSLIPRSANLPDSAPEPAPTAAPSSGLRKRSPIRRSPERAPRGAGRGQVHGSGATGRSPRGVAGDDHGVLHFDQGTAPAFWREPRASRRRPRACRIQPRSDCSCAHAQQDPGHRSPAPKGSSRRLPPLVCSSDHDDRQVPGRLVSPGADGDDSRRGAVHDVAARVIACGPLGTLAGDVAAHLGGVVAAPPASHRDCALGVFLLVENACPTLESRLLFRAVTYTTIGYGDLVLPKEWRMVGGGRGITGVLMCGLSAGIFFAVVTRILGPDRGGGIK